VEGLRHNRAKAPPWSTDAGSPRVEDCLAERDRASGWNNVDHMRPGPKSIVVTVGPDELVVSPRQVARYAGAGRDHMDTPQGEPLSAALERAVQLVSPAFVYTVYADTGFLSGGVITLENHTTLPMPPCAQVPGVQYLAVCVCPLGRKLEQMVQTVMCAGKGIEGLLLDAAGVAYLEAVSARTRQLASAGTETATPLHRPIHSRLWGRGPVLSRVGVRVGGCFIHPMLIGRVPRQEAATGKEERPHRAARQALW
jgi:hypothetical protein